MSVNTSANEQVLLPAEPISLSGKWIIESDGQTMLDPQTSGLIASDRGLWTISDRSAHKSQIQQLHLLDKASGEIIERLGPIRLNEILQSSCFSEYVGDNPDYEAIVVHPFVQDAWLIVTEDASSFSLPEGQCANRFANTGSTDYPTLLVELKLLEDGLTATGVRALQFAQHLGAGNFPNDGIEGMAIGKDHQLYIALEKDAKGHARIFSIPLTSDTFNASDAFLPVEDPRLHIPVFAQGNHPINGMDIYFPSEHSAGFLIAAARNDNELWIIDVSKKRPTIRLPLIFEAPSRDDSCEDTHIMDNASLEGVAVDGDVLYLVNDPWKVNYMKNVVCESDTPAYERMSPLLFNLPIDSAWFK